MVCVHLRELYALCQTHQLKLGGADLIRVVCTQCNRHDICPSTIHEEGESTAEDADTSASASADQQSAANVPRK